MADEKVVETPEVPETPEATEELTDQESVIQEMQSDALKAENTEDDPASQAEPGAEPENKEPAVEITESDVEELYTEKKTGVQKRIDKLVAERNSVKDELNALKQKVESLEKPKDEKRPEYSQEQLNQAEIEVERLLDEGDTKQAIKLERAIAKQRIAWARYEAEQDAYKPLKEQEETKQKIQAEWGQYVQEYEYNDDKDLSLTNQSSLIYKVINKLQTENPIKYAKYREFVWNKLADDAKDLILQARYRKATNKTSRKLEKELVNEKLKTQLGSGISSGAMAKEGKKYKTALDEVFAERQRIQDESMGLAK